MNAFSLPEGWILTTENRIRTTESEVAKALHDGTFVPDQWKLLTLDGWEEICEAKAFVGLSTLNVEWYSAANGKIHPLSIRRIDLALRAKIGEESTLKTEAESERPRGVTVVLGENCSLIKRIVSYPDGVTWQIGRGALGADEDCTLSIYDGDENRLATIAPGWVFVEFTRKEEN